MKTQTPVKIARIIARLNVGGPAMQAVLMTEALKERGYQTLLLTGLVTPDEASLEYLAAQLDVTPFKIAALSRRVSWWRDLVSFWEILRVLRREKPVIVHTHTAKAGTLGRLAAVLAGTPVRVHTFHGHVFNGYFSPLTSRAVIAIERMLARFTDRIVAVSESQKRELAEVYRIAPQDKIQVIPLGFDLDHFLRVAEKTELGSGASTVGWVGRFVPIKDPNFFVACAALIHRDNPETRFLMVGDGQLRPQCESDLERNQLTGVINIAGWQRELSTIYSQMDVVVSSSISEGTPLALLESMASARPFVATDVGGVRDLMVGQGCLCDGFEIFDNGILVPRSLKTLSHAVSYLLRKPELRRMMGRTGREYVRQRFSHHRLAEDLDLLYLSLAKSKGCLPSADYPYESRPSTLASPSQEGM